MPPAIKSRGEDFSTDSIISGLLLKTPSKAATGPKEGLAIQTISQGKNPLIRKTAIIIPQTKNHFRYLFSIVERTSALTTALSTLQMVSKRQSPRTIKMIEPISIPSISTLNPSAKFHFADGRT